MISAQQHSRILRVDRVVDKLCVRVNRLPSLALAYAHLKPALYTLDQVIEPLPCVNVNAQRTLGQRTLRRQKSPPTQ